MALPLASRFFTFYSFKGGVGRTMALLNCAYILAGAGRNVLMIDFDLEAPGLSFLIERGVRLGSDPHRKRPTQSSLKMGKGLVELITDFVESPSDWSLADLDSAEKLNDYITELEIPRSIRAANLRGRLALMPAGRLDEEYEARLACIHWQHPPLNKYRNDLFRHIRKLIERLAAFDYVLIDSRTGWSDEGYLSARILADHLIVLTGLNDQNITGTAKFLRHVESWPEESHVKRQVVLVESPVPEWEEFAKRERHREVNELFKRHLGISISFSHALPYHPLLALREEAIVANWPNSSLGRAYRVLTGIIRQLAEDKSERWVQRALNALRRSRVVGSQLKGPDLALVREALENLRPIDHPAFTSIAQTTATTLANLPEPIPGDIELMEYLIRCHPDNPFYLRQLARIQQSHDKFDAAKETLSQAINIAEKQNDQFELLQIEVDIAAQARKTRRLAETRVAYTRVLEIAHLIGDQSWVLFALFQLAELDRLQGNYKLSRQNFQGVFKISRLLKNRQQATDALCRLAWLDILQGDYESARLSLKEAEVYQPSKNKSIGISNIRLGLAALDYLKGNYKLAHQNLREVLRVFRLRKDHQGAAIPLHNLAEIEFLQGNYELAHRYYREAMEIFQSLEDHQNTAATLEGLGKLNCLQGNYKLAYENLQKALEIFQDLEARPGIASTLHNLAELDYVRSNYKSAHQRFKKALEIKKLIENRRELLITEMYFQALRVILEIHKSTTALDKAIEAALSLGDPSLSTQGLLLLAKAMHKLNNSNGALDKLFEAEKLCKEYGLAGLEAEARATMALLLAEQGNLKSAAEQAKLAISFFNSQQVNHPARSALDDLLKSLPAKST